MSDHILDQQLNTGSVNGIRPNAERARQTVVVLGIILLVNILSGVSSYFQLELLNEFNAGIEVSDARVDSNDTREVAFGIATMVLQIIGAIFFIRWFRRAYYNMGLRSTTSFSEGWAAGCWFVPIINLFRPYQIMSEMWNYTSEKLTGFSEYGSKNSGIVGVWWFLWILGTVGNRINSQLYKVAEDVDSLVTCTQSAMVLSFLYIPLTLVAIFMVKQYSQMEQELAQLDSTESESLELDLN